MFALISNIFARFTSLLGPKIGGTPVLMPRTQYYAISGRVSSPLPSPSSIDSDMNGRVLTIWKI